MSDLVDVWRVYFHDLAARLGMEISDRSFAGMLVALNAASKRAAYRLVYRSMSAIYDAYRRWSSKVPRAITTAIVGTGGYEDVIAGMPTSIRHGSTAMVRGDVCCITPIFGMEHFPYERYVAVSTYKRVGRSAKVHIRIYYDVPGDDVNVMDVRYTYLPPSLFGVIIGRGSKQMAADIARQHSLFLSI